jgi:hypothetical protein
MVLAIIADALQIIVFPLFVEGAFSPADDVLDFGIAAVLVHLARNDGRNSHCHPRRARARRRFSSFLDDGGCKRLSEIEADRSHRRRKS